VQVWGAYTFNSDDNVANRTFVNIKERDGFIIEPFTASIATAAVAIRYTYVQSIQCSLLKHVTPACTCDCVAY
jgi:hypothetical protein